MTGRVLWLAVTAALACGLAYVSRFWDLALWSRDGLFGIAALRPQGGLVGQWVRGTDWAPFELLLWAVGCFLVLTGAQKIFDRLTQGGGDSDD